MFTEEGEPGEDGERSLEELQAALNEEKTSLIRETEMGGGGPAGGVAAVAGAVKEEAAILTRLQEEQQGTQLGVKKSAKFSKSSISKYINGWIK